MFLGAISNAASIGDKSAQDGARIGDDFDAFLQLLTTQLENQSPLDPLDTNQFTDQLVQFAGVEQSIRTNGHLETIAQLGAANAATAAAGFIGKYITMESAQSELADGTAEWSYDAGGNGTAKFTIRDQSGEVIREEERSIAHGRGNFVWDGRTDAGSVAPDGAYQLTIDARDASGEPVNVAIEVGARIDGIDFSGGEPRLMAGDREIPLSEVRSVTGS